MSLAGVINSHTMLTLIVLHHGTEEQRRRFLPGFARGEARGGLALTEPHAGSDVQAIRTVARREGDRYVVNGTKMFITNGREGHAVALLALTDPSATPRHRGMSCFVVEKGHPGFRVMKSIAKLGYKGVDTAELVFEDCVVPADNLVGGVEGRGFKHVMSGLETGRVNVAARAVGVAQAALDETLARTRASRPGRAGPPAALADMATQVLGARLLTRWAAGMKDRGERCDLEAGMAKLYASEIAQQVAVAALRLHGADGQLAAVTAERHYRDTPLMIIGEGTNEIQRVLIARSLLGRSGERPGSLTSPEGDSDERRQMVLAVRQFVDKEVVPVVAEHERSGRYPGQIVRGLADLGILGTIVAPEHGGLGIDLRTHAMIVEELARGFSTVAALVSTHLAAARVLARHGTREQREGILPAATGGETMLTAIWGDTLKARHLRGQWVLQGTVPLVENAAHAELFIVQARLDRARTACFLVPRGTAGLGLGEPRATLGARGLELASACFESVTLPPSSVVGGEAGHGALQTAAGLALARLGAAAIAVGVAQAAFEAALRYSQQRTAFGKAICEHQAIQLKLADMATAITAARLLTDHAASHAERNERTEESIAMAKLAASEAALMVTLESMRIHGGYGYTAEFPVERYYRDAARLVLTPVGNEQERADLARLLVAY